MACLICGAWQLAREVVARVGWRGLDTLTDGAAPPNAVVGLNQA